MASNLSTIGFVFPDEASFQGMMLKCAGEAIAGLSCGAQGEYRIWRSRSGAELWFHIGAGQNGETEILGLTPFFEGQSQVKLKLTEAVHRPDDNPLEGAFYGWVSPDETGEGDYPLVFDAVDFAARSATILPVIETVRIAGFAREVKAFATEADYFAANAAASGPRLAAKSFIPMGLFAAASAADDAAATEAMKTPSSHALLTGRVLDHRSFTNETTDRPFHWMLVESLSATYDVLADPGIVQGEILPGATVEAVCWLFGRTLQE
jgi:hypothetical protein